MLTRQKCHAAQANNNHVRLLMIMLAGAVTHFAHTSNDDVCQGCCFDRQRDPYASFSMCAPCLLNLLVSTEQKRELVARLESIHYTERRSMTMTNENVGKTMRKHTSTLRAIATHIASHSDAKRKTTELDERATTSSLCDKSKRHWSTHEPEAEHEAGALQLYKKTGPLRCTKTWAPSCTNHRGPLLTINTGVPWLYKSRGLLVVQNRGSQKPGPLSCAKPRALSSTKAGAPWLETGAPSLYKKPGLLTLSCTKAGSPLVVQNRGPLVAQTLGPLSCTKTWAIFCCMFGFARGLGPSKTFKPWPKPSHNT